MKTSKSRLRAALVALPLTFAAVGLLVAAAPNEPAAAPVNQSVSAHRPNLPPPLSAEQLDVANSLSQAFRNVADRVLPAVVAIENRPDTSLQAARPSGRGQLAPGQNPFQGTPFEDMFRDGQMQGVPVPRQAPRTQAGIGSGVIIDSSGIVLTNNHVVAGGGKVIVKTQDGREFVAQEVFTDPKTDIAVVRIDGDDSLTAAPLGDSDVASVGDWVVALGQPFGLESTVTAGIISAKNRGIGITDRENFIQTDAAINPGNSGGPLVNLHGEVVGINTAISSRGGGNNGVGFAVPSNLARWVSDQLVQNGSVQRAYLGVGIQPVSYELATQLGVSPKSGVAVTNVFAGTPAEKMGFQSGDVIVKFGDTLVATPQQLQLAVERSEIGKTVAVQVVRDGEKITLRYSPEAAPEKLGNRPSKVQPSGVEMRSLGVEVSSLNAAVAKQLGLKDARGVVVTAVEENGNAAQAGLRPGMVIAQVNRQDVHSPDEFEQAIEADEDGSVLLLVRSPNGSQFIVVQR
ncbi:Do family serine endopeptidase [Roseimaritima ulvae]|uniref:Putative periplasmic serine endoprotease DegP-like n=1 Tax=Roseimaritima ulvae TaxID=980254 RepID=A0A5B9QQW9_9BACT|nr:Do family serine endopeptidase [Roseimaritima ulvae]QEG41507.1 putative periplasmic serine endoprotease DegP-like precursor [Roseimaritima ulvae]